MARLQYTPDQIRAGNANLLKLAAILDVADADHEAKGEPTYQQTRFSHKCGTPACALGHWNVANGRTPQGGDNDNYREFAIDLEEWGELFEDDGCGWAQSAAEAARYIRHFVEQREATLAERSA